MLLRILSVAALCLVTAACNPRPTSYERAGFRGGYSEEKVGDNLYLVSATGNMQTDKQRLQKIIMLRAAHLTRENGFSHFEVLLGTGAFANVNREVLSPLMAFRGGGGGGGFSYRPVMVTTTRTRSYSYPVYVGGYGGGAVYNTGSLLVRMVHGSGGTKGLPAFSAQRVIAKLGPQVALPQPEAK